MGLIAHSPISWVGEDMIRLIVLGFSFIGIVIFTVLLIYAILGLYNCREVMKDEEETY